MPPRDAMPAIRRRRPALLCAWAAAAALLSSGPVWPAASPEPKGPAGAEPAAAAGPSGGIGAITSVQGTVTMDHPDPEAPFQARTSATLQFQDVIETQSQSRTKVLLHSGGVLTVGENSRIEIIEHDHDPARPERSVRVKLVQGSLRALVGNDFASPGSRFEVRTPTATAQAHGGLFVVWADQAQSGAANIGVSGAVEFTSGGQTARLAPGEYSQAAQGAMPGAVARVDAAIHPVVNATIAATYLRESPRHQAPKETLQEIGMPRALGLGLGGADVGGAAAQGASDQSAGVDEAQGGGQTKSQTTPRPRSSVVPNHNRTPPSVHSGAADRRLRPHEGVPLRGQGRVRQ